MDEFSKRNQMLYFIIMLNRRIREHGDDRCSIPYKGMRYTPFILKYIKACLPKLFHINQIRPDNWMYHTGMRFRCNHIREDSIDFTHHYNIQDLTSLPFIFNSIQKHSGIYKLTCLFDKRFCLTMGLTNRNNFPDDLLNKTMRSYFFIESLVWSESHISLSRAGEFHVKYKNNMMEHLAHTKNVHFTPMYLQSCPLHITMSIIYDSYRNKIYFYENQYCIREHDVLFDEHASMVPFIHIHHNKARATHSLPISLRQRKQIRFIE